MVTAGPPAYAWDWFARQKLLWREAHRLIASSSTPTSIRYAAVSTRYDVVPMLRTDYRGDATVRAAVDEAVTRLAFLGRTDQPFDRLGVRNAPRGMRWWWSAITGEDLGHPSPSSPPPAADQLDLGEILGGYGDGQPIH